VVTLSLSPEEEEYLSNKGKAARQFTVVLAQLNFVLCRHFIMRLLSKRENGEQKYVNKTLNVSRD
jgi:hypothetical protein